MKYPLCWIAITLLNVQHPAFAEAEFCSEHAPLLDSGFYYEIDDPRQIPDQQLQLLRDFAKSLAGTWHGEETVALCEGHFSDPKTVEYDYIVNAEISTSPRGVVRLAADKERRDRSVSKIQTLWLTPETEAVNNRQRWHTLEFVDDNTLVYSHKYRAQNGHATGHPDSALSVPIHSARLIHEVNKLSINGAQLTIDRKLYINGAIVEQTGISLRKTT